MKASSKVFNFILLFLYIFDFTLPVIQRSSILAFLLAIVSVTLNGNARTTLSSLISTRTFRVLVLLMFVIIAIAFCLPVLHNTYDFSFLKTLFYNLFALICGAVVCAVIYSSNVKARNIRYILSLIVGIFLLQSLIEMTGIINSSFRAFIQSFNSGAELSIERGLSFRSLALSNATIATLGGLFGVLYVIFFYSIMKRENFKISFALILTLIILFIGNFFGGRTGYIGLIVGLVGFFIYKKSFKVFLRFASYLIVLITAIIYLYNTSLLPLSAKLLIDQRVLPFVFEAFYNYEDNQGFQTSSSTSLIRDHYFVIEPRTFILGDGQFTQFTAPGSGEATGHYKQTDAGFMRIVLYGGIFFQLLMFLWFLISIWPFYKSSDKADRYLFYMLLVYSTLFHVKTISYAYATFNNRLMFIVLFYYLTMHYSSKTRNIVKPLSPHQNYRLA